MAPENPGTSWKGTIRWKLFGDNGPPCLDLLGAFPFCRLKGDRKEGACYTPMCMFTMQSDVRRDIGKYRHYVKILEPVR